MTTQQCVLGDHAGTFGRYACHRCTEHLRRLIREIETYEQMRALPTSLLPARGGASARGGSGFGSRPPADLDVIVAGDRRSTRLPLDTRDHDPVTDDEQPGVCVLEALESEARSARESLGDPQPSIPATLSSEVGYLLGAVERIALEPWVDDFADAITDLHREVRRLARDQPAPPLAPCLSCGEPVFWTQDAHLPPEQRRDTARCSGCRREFTGFDLLRLRSQVA